MKTKHSSLTGALSAAAVSLMVFAAPAAHAAIFDFTTPTGSTVGGLPVSASATITTGTNSISVTLRDLQANPLAAGQLLSDLFFTYSGGALTGASLSSSSGQEVTVASNGTFTLGSTPVGTGWGISASGSTLHLDGLAGTSTPAHTIIGPPGGGGTYSNANSSIAGNGPHNPFLNQTANFVISLIGITSATNITGAIFSFGTESGNNVTGVPSAVPLPGALPLFATGLAALALLRRKKKRKAEPIAV